MFMPLDSGGGGGGVSGGRYQIGLEAGPEGKWVRHCHKHK